MEALNLPLHSLTTNLLLPVFSFPSAFLCGGYTRPSQEHQGLKCPPLSVSVHHLSCQAIAFFYVNLGYLLQQTYNVHGGSIMSKTSLANLQSLWIKKTVIYQIRHAQQSLQSQLWKHLKQYSQGSVEVKCNIKYILDVSVGLWVLDGCQHSVLSLDPWTTLSCLSEQPLCYHCRIVLLLFEWIHSGIVRLPIISAQKWTICILMEIENRGSLFQGTCRYAFFVLASLHVLKRGSTLFTYASLCQLCGFFIKNWHMRRLGLVMPHELDTN